MIPHHPHDSLFNKNERNSSEGQSLVEYVLILALIAILSVSSLIFLGDQVTQTLSTITSTLQSAL